MRPGEDHAVTWSILYRGSLSSCNYACGYCPFAKRANTRAELARDFEELERFVDWVSGCPRELRLLLTPWGEALIHRAYRRSLVRLSLLPRVRRVAIQTNLSAPLQDLAGAGPSLALWASFHPSQVTVERFLSRCRKLDELGLRYSVGVVGLREHFQAIEELRARLPRAVYLWVNAFQRSPDSYRPEEVERLVGVDPYFRFNLPRYRSLDRACRTGQTSFTVDGKGDVRRCHFVGQVLGNVYEPGFEDCLRERLCPAERCGCHIGYVHRPELRLEEVFGEDGLLERIPLGWPEVDSRAGGLPESPAGVAGQAEPHSAQTPPPSGVWQEV